MFRDWQEVAHLCFTQWGSKASLSSQPASQPVSPSRAVLSKRCGCRKMQGLLGNGMLEFQFGGMQAHGMVVLGGRSVLGELDLDIV